MLTAVSHHATQEPRNSSLNQKAVWYETVEWYPLHWAALRKSELPLVVRLPVSNGTNS